MGTPYDLLTEYNRFKNHENRIDDLLKYWIKRCKAAEEYIRECPCDPGTTNDQLAAYIQWQEIVSKEGK